MSQRAFILERVSRMDIGEIWDVDGAAFREAFGGQPVRPVDIFEMEASFLATAAPITEADGYRITRNLD